MDRRDSSPLLLGIRAPGIKPLPAGWHSHISVIGVQGQPLWNRAGVPSAHLGCEYLSQPCRLRGLSRPERPVFVKRKRGAQTVVSLEPPVLLDDSRLFSRSDSYNSNAERRSESRTTSDLSEFASRPALTVPPANCVSEFNLAAMERVYFERPAFNTFDHTYIQR